MKEREGHRKYDREFKEDALSYFGGLPNSHRNFPGFRNP